MEFGDQEHVIKEVKYDSPSERDSKDNREEKERDLGSKKIYQISSRHPSVATLQCTIIRDGFGLLKHADDPNDTKVIYRFTIVNKNNISVQVMTYGGTITSIKVPDKNGFFDDIVLGYEYSENYRSPKNPYFGATIGRITGVIPQYVFSIDGEKYYLSSNYLEGHHANGGFVGFDRVMWNYYIYMDKLYLSYMSKDMEEGFPGDVLVNRSYELTPKNELIIETRATCSKPTPIDISTHIDFNLSSHLGGPKELYKHYLMVNADKYGQISKQGLLTGKLKKVNETVLDLRLPRPLGKIIHKIPGGGFDHYMNLTQTTGKNIIFAAKLMHPGSGRFIEVLTDQPGLQVYSQNNLYAHKNMVQGHPISCWCHDPSDILNQQKPENESPTQVESLAVQIKNDQEVNNLETESKKSELVEAKDSEPNLPYSPLEGKLGAEYVRHGGIRLVPVNYPEPIARFQDYNKYLIYPGETYVNTTVFKFGIRKAKPVNLSEIPEVIVPEPLPDFTNLENENAPPPEALL